MIAMDKEVILYVIAIQFSCYVFLNAKCMDKCLPSLFMRSESMTTQIPICDLGRVGSNIHEDWRINEVIGIQVKSLGKGTIKHEIDTLLHKPKEKTRSIS